MAVSARPFMPAPKQPFGVLVVEIELRELSLPFTIHRIIGAFYVARYLLIARGGFLRGRPPFAPLILAALRFASDFDLPPSFPSRAAALFFMWLGEPFAGVMLANWKARGGQEFGAFDVSEQSRAGHVIDRSAVETVVGDFGGEVFHGEEFAA